MAYKFQLGASEMGGALTQEGALVVESSISGSTTIAGASVAVDGKVAGSELSSSANLNAGGNLVVAGTVKLAGVAAAAVDVAADSVYILDADGFMKKESFSDYASALAGTSITATSGVLTVSDNGVTLAKMAGLARGKIIIGDSSGDPSALALGSATQFMVSDGDDMVYRSLSGDATLAADGAMTIANDAVSLAKMAGLARGKFIVGDSSGNPSALALGTTAQFLVSDNDDAIWRTLSGDATLGADGALTIANDAIEQAMIADDAVGADQLAANAVVEGSIVDNAVTLAKMAGLARGKIILGDSSGDPSALALGSAHQFFQSDGTDAAWVSMSGDVALAAGVATIQANAVEGSMLNNDVISAQTNLASGLAGTDEFMISDAGVLKRLDLNVYGAFLAGNGLTNTNGVLSLDSAGTPSGFGDAAATMVEGVNYGTTTLTADRVWTLPGSPTVGDVVRIKAPAAMGGNKIVVTPSAGKTIDGAGTVDLESPGAAIALIYLTTNTWGIF
jgi:hypothetical protein